MQSEGPNDTAMTKTQFLLCIIDLVCYNIIPPNCIFPAGVEKSLLHSNGGPDTDSSYSTVLRSQMCVLRLTAITCLFASIIFRSHNLWEKKGKVSYCIISLSHDRRRSGERSHIDQRVRGQTGEAKYVNHCFKTKGRDRVRKNCF